MDNIYINAANIMNESNNIIFFGGAGVSTECGIPDFRSQDGIYNQKQKFNYPPETILSSSFFFSHPNIFYDFLKENILKYKVLPNTGHRAIAELERMGKIKAVITQNIDCLHQEAGSRNVIELHGSLSRFYCIGCKKEYSIDFVMKSNPFPKCSCGGIVRPDIVLYEETLDEGAIESAVYYISNADVLLIAGTSLVVYPAAGLLRYFKRRKIIIINKDKTSYDSCADIVINKPFAKTMDRIMEFIKV